MNTFVKICGLRSAADVAAAVAAGANAVGFVFTESLRKVTPAQAKLAAADVPANVRRVAVMHHPDNELCQQVIDEFAPDVIQTDAEDFGALAIPAHIECWPVFREGGAEVASAGVYVYEGAVSGSGTKVDWARAAEVARRGRMILAGGLAEDNVRLAMQTARPWGVDVSSGVESLPGYKDHDLVRRFIGAVRAAEKEL